jgi:large repetitive protein
MAFPQGGLVLRRIFVRPRRLGTPVVLCAALATFAAFAVNSQGFPVQHVSLNDGSIWVTDNAIGAAGRFDKPVAQLDGQVNATSAVPSLDVAQNGALVVTWDKSVNRLYSVDVYKPAFADGGTTVSAADVALGGSTLAVLGTDRTLRTTTLEAEGGSLAAVGGSAPARASHLPADAAIAVAADGTAYVAGGRKLLSFPVAGSPGTAALPLPATDQLQVTTVGDVPVVADVTTRTLYFPASGRTVALPGQDTSTGLELQQSSASSGVVAVATTQGLYRVNLASGQLTTVYSGRHGEVAAPAQVAGCIHAAWNDGSSGTYVRSCDGQPPSGPQSFALASAHPVLVFRVNRGAVVLNDTADGGVFLLDTKITDAHPKWQQLTRPQRNHDTNQNDLTEQTQTPLIAKPDQQGVRPGRTTVVHVLDNDSGPAGRPLAVTAVGQPDQAGVTVTIAPDAQTVLATVGTGLAAPAHFQYTIDDGRGRTASAQVTLVPRGPDENLAPALRTGYHPPSLSVASGGSLTIPVIGDWRDFDGDPLFVDSGHITASAGTVSVTSGGDIAYTAPQAPSPLTATIRYAVSDGIVPAPVPATLTVSVLGTSSTQLRAPQAEPDVAQAITGMPVTIQPLGNDLPGADPTNPQARLTLAAPVAAVPGADVSTDLRTGTVTFTARRPGSFFLTYEAAYGAAPTARGTIRIQASPAAGQPKPPVTTPAAAVIHGQQPALTDVLARDYDPQGWVMGVTAATSPDPGIHVIVVDQRWLRISSEDPQPGHTATVSYTVSDGSGSAAGTVSVTAEPADASADQITTADSAITIRAGDSAAVPVLASDSSSTGLPLTLAGIEPAASPAVPGLLASNQGGDVRVTAPASVQAEQETTVSYVATDASGAAATGHLDVTIEPLPTAAHPNQAPAPEEVDARETAGDVLTIHIPAYGIDPDGDSTAVTAVTVPPALGRVVSTGPDTITYQSYPTSSGTDTFTYQVTDPWGATGTAQVRVGILPPGPPQPPVAADVVLSAPPGAAVAADVLANAFVAPGDQATVVPLAQTDRQLPAGVRLAGSMIYLHAPARAADAPLQVTFGITDGSSVPSLAQVIVRAVPGAKLPPVANDDVASPPAAGASTVTVDVLRNDYDPAGSPGDLRISAAARGVTINGGSLTIPLRPDPREVPYQVKAPDGLTATAVVDVPGTATSRIRLKPGARIKVGVGGSVSVPLGSVLTDSLGRPLQITTLDQLYASPHGDVSVDAHQATAFTVHGLGRYAGPGAVTVQVYDGASLQDRNGQTTTVTIPVQVGPDVPLLRCPQAALPVIEGGHAQVYDIGLLCHVWVDTTVATRPPSYTAAWTRPASGVSAQAAGGTLTLSAGSGARPGATGSLRITPIGATAGGTVAVAVTAAPPPAGRAVTVSTLAGHPVTVDLTQYVTSPLPQPDIEVLHVSRPAGAAVSSSGSRVTITPAASTHGAVTVTASVTDAQGHADRQISLAITVDVIGVPGSPGPPTASASDHTLVVSFGPAASNGAPIDHYTVYTNGAPHVCPAAPCTISGLQNISYDIYVTAHNSAGDGPPSSQVKATPDQVPNQVTGLKTDPADGQVTLSWPAAVVDGSPVRSYQVETSPAPASGSAISTLGGSARSTTVTGLTNGTSYSFRVQAANTVGAGPWSVGVSATPFGKPLVMPAPTATGAAVPDPAATRAITVSWAAASDNGRAISAYTVTEYRSSNSSGPWTQASTATEPPGGSQQSFTVNNDGTWYEYSITATNQAGTSPDSPQSSPAIQGAAPPDAPGGLSAKDHDAGSDAGYGSTIHVDFTVPQPNSAQLSSVEYGLNGTSVSGTWNSPGSPGSSVDEAIGGLTVGSNYVVYVRGCNDAGLCGPWAGPSNQVTPYGPPGAPTVSATPSGTSINYSWGGGGGNGRPVSTYHVCFDSSCSDMAAGSTSTSYGYNQTHKISVYVVDTAGQQSQTVSQSATTANQPAAVSVTRGNNEAGSPQYGGACANNPACFNFLVTVSGFPANTGLSYTCADNGQVWWPSDTKGWNGGQISTNGSGNTSFYTECLHAADNSTVTINVSGGGVSESNGYRT